MTQFVICRICERINFFVWSDIIVIEKYKFKNYKPSTITFYDKEREMILREPSLAAIDSESGIIRFAGNEAGRIDNDIREKLIIGSPFKQGVVADFDIAASLISVFIKMVTKYGFLVRPKIAVCANVDMTDVEHRALTECMYKVGAKKVHVMEESFSTAIQQIPSEYELIIEITPGMDS